MNIKRIVPNSLTCCNLLCGSIAIFLASQGEFTWAFICIICGAFFDFFDGMSARLLNAPSPIGVELDSLADVITFGLAPSMMLFCFLLPILGWWALLALLMAAFSALRLETLRLEPDPDFRYHVERSADGLPAAGDRQGQCVADPAHGPAGSGRHHPVVQNVPSRKGGFP